MSKVIEIIDSDEDAPPQVNMQRISNAVAHIEEDGTAAAGALLPGTISPPPLTAAPAAVLTPTSRNRNRRKSVLQPMCTSPDMQFETIALDDDDESLTHKKNSARSLSKNDKPAIKSSIPKILNTKSSKFKEELKAAHKRFLDSADTTALLQKIAEERVRINYMLATCGMPDIKFSLYMEPERLRFQFDERLKQRKRREGALNSLEQRQ